MKRLVYIFLLIFVTFNVYAVSETAGNHLYSDGLEALKAGRYETASLKFRELLANPKLSYLHSDALLALSKSEQIQGNYRVASGLIDQYIRTYPNSKNYEEALYMRGRLLHLDSESDKSIVALERFIRDYPRNPLLPSAYYWIGEALMSLGRLEDADSIFALVQKQYPTSVKREAARYRRREIELMYRERELLDILKWSHEEYIREAEEFYRREAAYKQALQMNRSQLTGRPESGADSSHRERLLSAKERLLELKVYYINQLLRFADER